LTGFHKFLTRRAVFSRTSRIRPDPRPAPNKNIKIIVSGVKYIILYATAVIEPLILRISHFKARRGR